MRTHSFPLSLLLVSFACFGCTTVANSPKPPAEHEAHMPQSKESSPELQRIKSLEGTWMATTSMFGEKDQKVYTKYSVTAGGSAVLERIFPDTPHEMVSVYYDDDSGKLAMTHYCIMQNRPQFTLAGSSPTSITLGVTKVEGRQDENTPSMGTTTIRFEDEDHYSSTCEGENASGEKQEPMTIRFTRVSN